MKIIGSLVVAVIVIGVGVWAWQRQSAIPSTTAVSPVAIGPTAPAATPTPVPTTATGTTVHIKNSAFSAATVTVKVGDTVTWVNDDSIAHMVASDPHPTHTILPALQSTQIAVGESYSFTFTTAGTFPYHCHIHPNMKGTVIVQ